MLRRSRRWIPLLALLLAALPSSALPDETARRAGEDLAVDDEIVRITLIRLGGSFPADRGEGRFIPIWVIGHFDRDFLGEGRSFSAWVKTTRLEARVLTPLGKGWRTGAELTGEVISSGDALFRYEDGEEFPERAFEASSAGGSLLVDWEGSAGMTAALRYRVRRYIFDESSDTAPTFVLPVENTTHGARLDLGFEKVRTFQNREIREGFQAGLFAEYERRDTWRSWGDEPGTLSGFADSQDFWRYGANLSGYLRFFRHHGLEMDLAARFGEDLDFLSEYTLGSQLSALRVVGYYYAEFRASRVLLANLGYGANLWEGARGTLLLDGAYLRETADGWRWITGVGVALRQKVWLGIPVRVQYGYGVDGKRDGTRGGHEIFLSITAAF